MTSPGTLTSDGTRCYTGPSCKRHGIAAQRADLENKINSILEKPASQAVTSPYATYEEYRQALLEILYENDEHTDDHFTSGACHRFALALHKATGYPIVVVASTSRKAWSHMGVRAPDGRIWDVTGPFEKDAGFLDDWTGYHTYVPEGEGVLWEVNADEYATLTEKADGPNDYIMDPAPAVDVVKRAMKLIPPARSL